MRCPYFIFGDYLHCFNVNCIAAASEISIKLKLPLFYDETRTKHVEQKHGKAGETIQIRIGTVVWMK